MKDLTVRNIPDSVYHRLKALADKNRRSMNSEIIRLLERSVGLAPVDVASLLARVRAVRERGEAPYLTDEALRASRVEGRA